MAPPVPETIRKGHWNCLQLKAGDAAVEVIPDRGGIITQWNVVRQGSPLPLLWLRPGYHDEPPDRSHPLGGGIPVLFPCCGPTASEGQTGRYVAEWKPYFIGIHGFGPWARWAIVEARQEGTSAVATLALRDTPETRQVYPFAFETVISYSLHPRSLRVDWTVENRSSSPLPVSPGLHPYFRLPFTNAGSRDEVTVTTSAKTRFLPEEPVRIWSGRSEPLPSGQFRLGDLPFGGPFTVGEYAEPRFTVRDPACGIEVEATWPAPQKDGDGPYLNFYTPDAKTPTFCVEPFLGLQNAFNHGRGLVRIAPGQRWTWWFQMSVRL